MASCIAEAGASSANHTLCRGPLLRAGCSCAFELFFQQLLLIQIRVVAAAGEQFVMRATLGDGAFDKDDEGAIAERGTHDELLARGGYYADLYQKQLLEEELERA